MIRNNLVYPFFFIKKKSNDFFLLSYFQFDICFYYWRTANFESLAIYLFFIIFYYLFINFMTSMTYVYFNPNGQIIELY